MLHVQSLTVHLVRQKNVAVWAQSLFHWNAGLDRVTPPPPKKGAT